MTWMPRRHPHEITDKAAGLKLVKRINRWLIKQAAKSGVYMLAKLDPHHNCYQPDETYLVEVVPFSHFQTEWLETGSTSYKLFMDGIDNIIRTFRVRFDLVPSLRTRVKGVDLEWPGGGCHLQMGADLFHQSTQFYRQMERFHRDLVTDYANRPFIRWLLAHWIGDGGSRVVVNRARLEQGPISKETLWLAGLIGGNTIEPRFMTSSKNSYLTFEFRMVGMVENARQLRAAVRLIQAWINYHVSRVDCCLPAVRFTLTPARWDLMTKEDSARALCRGWVEELGLQWEDYEEDFFQRNYLMRIMHGQFV